MYCRECGKKVDQWVKFCPYCGAETNFPEEEIKKEEQAKMLYEMGCDLAQGYYFGKPVPVEEFFRKMNKEI